MRTLWMVGRASLDVIDIKSIAQWCRKCRAQRWFLNPRSFMEHTVAECSICGNSQSIPASTPNTPSAA